MNAEPTADPVGLDDVIGVERASRWPWAVPRVGSLSGEGSDPPTAQGRGTLNPADRDLIRIGALPGGRGLAWSLARPAPVRAVIAGGGWSWLPG